jgi:hypothetical protein
MAVGQYVCGCGASGYRPANGGGIRAHAKPRTYGAEPTVRPRGDVEVAMGSDDFGHRGAPGCGRVPPKKGAE